MRPGLQHRRNTTAGIFEGAQSEDEARRTYWRTDQPDRVEDRRRLLRKRGSYEQSGDAECGDARADSSGRWTIGGFFFEDPLKGPIVVHFIPQQGTVMFGRSGFMIHGDNPATDHTASEGYVILARPCREAIAASADYGLIVT
jgi:hypothetical protein